jgi:hypothetical protein
MMARDPTSLPKSNPRNTKAFNSGKSLVDNGIGFSYRLILLVTEK